MIFFQKHFFSYNELRLWLPSFRRRKNHQKVGHNSDCSSRNSWLLRSWRATGWSGNRRLRNYSRFGSWPVVAKLSTGRNFRYGGMYRDGVVPDQRRTRTAVRICALSLAGGDLSFFKKIKSDLIWTKKQKSASLTKGVIPKRQRDAWWNGQIAFWTREYFRQPREQGLKISRSIWA